MDLLYVLDYRFFQTPDGAVWTPATYPYAFWDRYRTVFSRVHVISRAAQVSEPQADWQQVDGDHVTVHPIPFYQGPLQYLLRRAAVRRAMARALDREGAILLRIPSQLATCAESVLKATKRGFGVEVVGDPWESFAPGAVEHLFRAWFRHYYRRNQQRQCANAVGAYYVAGHLMRRYPSNTDGFSTICSDVCLTPDAYWNEPRAAAASGPLRIATVASLDQTYKGIDILLEAAGTCVTEGMDLQLTVIGSGKYGPRLQAQASQGPLAGRVEFLGQLPAGATVRDALKKANLFILPSRTEGMPRALLEAMALGMPCLGTQVGGIPEVLDAADTFAPNDVGALAGKLRKVAGVPERMVAMSGRNYQTALGFSDAILQQRRQSFYRTLSEIDTSESTPHQPAGATQLPWWKRPLDLAGAMVLGFCTWPLWLGAMVLIRVALGSPVLFRQLRPGRGGKTFTLYKLRTMKAPVPGGPNSDAMRLTRLGHWLRRFSIDELPQLWNVFRGEMSLVGPRPLLVEYLPLYSRQQSRRHEVNPGLTGWAQIQGRNSLSWSQRFELDVWYVDHQSLTGDLSILFISAATVLRGRGVNQPGQATASRFDGVSDT